MPIPGFEIPIHRSLTEQILVAGVPRNVAILIGTAVAALGLGLHSLTALPVGLIVHLVAAAVTRMDPQFFDCFMRHLRLKDRYVV